jgi:hypothetical protein
VATPPTLISYTEVGNVATTPTTGVTTATIPVLAGDYVAVFGAGEDRTNIGPITVSLLGGVAGTLTITQSDATTSYAPCAQGWAQITSSGNLQVKAVGTDSVHSEHMNAGAWVYRNAGGIGVSGKAHLTTGTPPQVTLAGCSANSAVACVLTDWSAINAARTYVTVNGAGPTERGHFADGSTWHYDNFEYADIGSVASPTVGESAPAGQTPNLLAIEVLASAGGGGGPQAVWVPRRMPLGV